jgi:hypothetical protein
MAEYELPAIEVPATNDGVVYALPDLKANGMGEEYVFVSLHNGSAYAGRLQDATGRKWHVKSGQPFEFDLEVLGRGVKYLSWVPAGGNIGAAEVVIIPTIRRPRLASFA